MKKTTIYLPDELKEQVEALAKLRQQSEAEVIRLAISEYAARAWPRPRLPLFPKGTMDPTLAQRVDEVLAEGFGRD